MRRLSGAVLGAVLVAVVGFAGPAAAHVTIDPGEAVQGGYARVVFRVPNERDNARVTKLQIRFPVEHPVPGVRTMPVPGWKVTAKTRELDVPVDRHGIQVNAVVSELSWAASGKTGIAPGEFLEFPVYLGPLPKTPTLVFPAVQTYSNGDVVTWAETPTADEEPEHPAPVLLLARAPAAPDPGGATVAGPTTPAGSGDSGGTPLWLGIAALVAGLVGLLLGVVAVLRTRERGRWSDFGDEPDDEWDEESDEEPLDEEPEDESDDEREPPPPPPRRPSPHPQTP